MRDNSADSVLVLTPLCQCETPATPERRLAVVLCTAERQAGFVPYEKARLAYRGEETLECPIGCETPHPVVDTAAALERGLIVADEDASTLMPPLATIIANSLRFSTGTFV